MEKAALLIDGGYLDHAKKALGRQPIDFTAMGNELVTPYQRTRTYYYHAAAYVDARNPDPRDLRLRSDQQRFFDGLSLLERFEVKLGHLQRFSTFDSGGKQVLRHRQKLVDVLLSIDLVKLAWAGRIELGVLLAGDSDFVPAVQAAKEAGIAVRLVFARTANCYVDTQLKKTCDERVELTDEHFHRWAMAGPARSR